MSRTRKRSAFAASHQRSWLWGRHAVIETLQAGRWPIVELLVSRDLEPAQLDLIASLARPQGLHILYEASDRLAELCQASDHQGHLLRLGQFPCGSLDDLRSLVTKPATAKTLPLMFVICDRIHDAHNFGAILRSCDAMAVDGVIIGTNSQCRITPHVARSSSGAINHLTIYETENLTEAVELLKSASIRVVAASEKSAHSLWSTGLTDPQAVIIGAEATGVHPALLALADIAVCIPMLGQGTSLNAAVAAGVLLTEIRRQHQTAAKHE